MNNDIKSKLQKGYIIAKKYVLVEKLGSGGMNSTIWKAQLLDTSNMYQANFCAYRAIKIIDFTVNVKNLNRDDLINNINREINITQRASYKSKQYFCQIYEWFWLGSDDNYFCIVMELVDGITLRSYLDNKGMIPLVEAMDIYQKILLAIRSLHQMNQDDEIILHRDLKLENVMLTSDCSKIKIIDFGIATVVDNTNLRSLKIDEKNLYGTKGYLPPDVKRFKKSDNNYEKAKIINEFLDIFAAANILYRLLTSEQPYYESKNDHKSSFYLKPETYDFRSVSSYIPNTPPIIENILYKSIVSIPNEKHLRYKNVDEVLSDVKKWKDNPNDQSIKIIKPDGERKIEKISKILTLHAKYEITSLLWFRSFVTISSFFLLVIGLLIWMFLYT